MWQCLMEDLLAHPEVDIVCVCMPSGQHAAQLQRRAGALFQRIYSAIQAGDLGELTLGVVPPYHRSQAYYDRRTGGEPGPWTVGGC